MPTFDKASCADILLRLRDALVTGMPIHVTRVMIVAQNNPEDTPHFGAEQDILLQIGGESPDVAAIDGGGRYVNRRERMVRVVPRVRLSLDPAGTDGERLTKEHVGYLRFEDRVIDVVEQFLAFDQPGNLLAEPGRVGSPQAPRPDTDDKNWLHGGFDVAFTYLRDLELPEY